MAKETNLYIRNARPNMVILRYNGLRQPLEHRGSRKDSWALPAEARTDPTISKWLRDGTLEEISKEAFMQLGKRQVDILPNEYLKRNVRSQRGNGVPLVAADGDATGTKTQLDERELKRGADPRPAWAADLMTTEEELEHMDFSEKANYPSHHRDDDEHNRQMGY